MLNLGVLFWPIRWKFRVVNSQQNGLVFTNPLHGRTPSVFEKVGSGQQQTAVLLAVEGCRELELLQKLSARALPAYPKTGIGS